MSINNPTLREAMDVWLKQDYLPARQADVVCHAIMDVAKLYSACELRADTYSPADGSYEDGLRDWARYVSSQLKSISIDVIGLDTLVEPQTPMDDWVEEIANTDDPNVVKVTVRRVDGARVTHRMAKKPILERIEALKKKVPSFPQGPYWPIVPRDNIKEGVQTVRVRFCHRGERPAQIKYDPNEDW